MATVLMTTLAICMVMLAAFMSALACMAMALLIRHVYREFWKGEASR